MWSQYRGVGRRSRSRSSAAGLPRSYLARRVARSIGHSIRDGQGRAVEHTSGGSLLPSVSRSGSSPVGGARTTPLCTSRTLRDPVRHARCRDSGGRSTGRRHRFSVYARTWKYLLLLVEADVLLAGCLVGSPIERGQLTSFDCDVGVDEILSEPVSKCVVRNKCQE